MEIRLKTQIDPAGGGWQMQLHRRNSAYTVTSTLRSFGRQEHSISNGSDCIVLRQGAQTQTLNILNQLTEGQCAILLDLMLIGFAEVKLQVHDELDPMAADAIAGRKLLTMLGVQSEPHNGKVTLPTQSVRLIEQLSTDLHQVTNRLRQYFDWDERLARTPPSVGLRANDY